MTHSHSVGSFSSRRMDEKPRGLSEFMELIVYYQGLPEGKSLKTVLENLNQMNELGQYG